MATSTAAAIRDRAITVIKAIVPSSDSTLHFIPFENEFAADFRYAMNGAPDGGHRRFQVRTTGLGRGPTVTNSDVEERILELEVVVAYPQDHRWGADNALDRDDVMEQDRNLIETEIGVRGAANFTASTADACWLDADFEIPFERDSACDFLVIRQRMSYWLQLAPNVTQEKEVFRYTALGSEGASFSVSLPEARADLNYNVQVQQGGPSANAFKEPRPLVSSFTTTTFTLELAAAAEAGDVFMFTVDQLTT